jgi:pyruvate dehydrogenase E2 component (dihydrolipoamide acetyltransferase)
MAVSVVMPALEMAQETGKLVSWLKKEGEPVKKGEMLLEVETDKAVVEVEALADGILAGVTARNGDVVPVGTTIAWLVKPGETAPTASADVPAQTGRRTDNVSTQAVAATAEVPAGSTPGSLRISPKARRLAREHGVDVGRVRGSGEGGEILADDVMAAVQGARNVPAAAAATPTVRAAASGADIPSSLSAIGRLMAERTTQSWSTVPHFFVTREVDARALVAARERFVATIERSRGVKPTHTDLLVALVARALRQHPRMNASWIGDSIRANADINIGIAMAVNDGVVAAVVPKADGAGIGDIAVRRRDLTERARTNRLQPADITGATFTISNLGMYEVDEFTAIIVPPQAGILAVGAITNRVVPIDGEAGMGIGVRPMISITLSCDHRVVDGARGAAFLNDVVKAIREPDKWLT